MIGPSLENLINATPVHCCAQCGQEVPCAAGDIEGCDCPEFREVDCLPDCPYLEEGIEHHLEILICDECWDGES